MKTISSYTVTLKHDYGTINIETAATSKQKAIDIVLLAENAPKVALVSVHKMKELPL